MSSVYLKSTEVSGVYGHGKVWRRGLEVAIKIKGSQGNRCIEWHKPGHPCTTISDQSDVHANHNEANNRHPIHLNEISDDQKMTGF